MRFKIMLVLSIFAITTVSACGGKRHAMPPANFVEHFTTEIRDDDLKQFYLSIRIEMQTRRGMGEAGRAGGRRGGNRRRGGSVGQRGDLNQGQTDDLQLPPEEVMRQRFEHMLQQKLDGFLAETGFCQNGYNKTGSFVGRGYAEIKGDCIDRATKEDWEKFGALKNY